MCFGVLVHAPKNPTSIQVYAAKIFSGTSYREYVVVIYIYICLEIVWRDFEKSISKSSCYLRVRSYIMPKVNVNRDGIDGREWENF